METQNNIFVFDLDGTIVFNGRAIEPKIKEKLLQLNQKATLIFASARPIRDMLPLLEDFPSCDLIGANGAMYRKNQQIQLTAFIPNQAIETCFQLIEAWNLDYIVDYAWDYSARISNPQNPILAKLDPEHLAEQVALSSENITKIILFNVTAQQAKELQLLTATTLLYHEEVKEFLVTADKADKYSALKILIGKQPYIAFGNDHNDRTMLEKAEEGYVVGNLLQSQNYHSIEAEDLVNYLDKWVTK